MGWREAAFAAGYQPKKIPIRIGKPTATVTAPEDITGIQPEIRAPATLMMMPRIRPIKPPDADTTTDSERNCFRMKL